MKAAKRKTKNAQRKTALGKAGSFAFSAKEAKEIRKNFIPVTNLDHLALYIDGTKFSPESFDRFFDSNLRKKGAQAFNLKWIKKGGAKVDQLALSVQNDVQGYNVKDESDIIEDIQYLVTTYPAGFTEYYFEASQHNEDEYKNDNANIDDMNNETERQQANEAFEAGLKKNIKPKTRLKRVVKTVTKTVTKTKRKTINKTKQVYTTELAILKRFFALHNKPVKVTQLTSLQSGLKTAIATGKNHLQLIKIINAKLSVAITKLQNANVGNIKKFEISKDLLAKVNAVVTAPKVKQVTLGGLKNHQKQYNKEVDAYKWFVIELSTNKPISGFEFKGDAIDLLNDFEAKTHKVVAKSSLKKLGIADPSESWKHKDTSKTKGYLGAVEMNLQQYLNQKDPIKNVTVLLKPNDYKLGAFYKTSYESRQQIFITNPQFVKEFGGIEYVLKNGDSTLYTTDSDGNAKRASVFVIEKEKSSLGTPKKSVKGNWTLADKKKLAKELGHEFYNAEDWRKLTGKEKPSSKKKSNLGSFSSEHKEAIKEAANDVKNAGDLLAKAKKNKESATKIAQLKKAKKPTKTKSTNLGNAQNGVAEARGQQPKASSQKSPFQTMDKLVSGGTYQLAGERGKLLGNLGQVDCSITIRGDQGAGKSQLMWQLVNDFASIGKRVAVVSPEMNGSSPTISKYRDKYITPENSCKILFTDKKLTVKEIKDLNASYDVVFVDSFNQLANYEQKQFEWLCKELPTKCIIGLFQSTTGGEMRGGNSPEFDAYVNIEVTKVDDSFVNNYAICTKNRFGGTGAKYNISSQKIMKEKTNGLNGVGRYKTAKKAAKKLTKSVEASKVLKLMDDDYSYQNALKLVLSNNKTIDKTKLEKELNKYI